MNDASGRVFSPSQRRIAQAIAEAECDGVPALVPMLVEALGYQAESSVTPTLKIMERDGLIEIHGGGRQRAYRFLSLTSKARQMLGVGGLPILGRIPAGPLQEALTEPEGFLESSSLLPHRPGDFLLRVTGDSMTGDGIRDGDLVLLRPGEEVRKGEIAAAYIGRGYEATLKHVYPLENGVLLVASNHSFPDMFVPKGEWSGVAGVYRGLIRQVRE